MNSFFWHDYETFGADPVRDRPAQFAGIRTDADLNIIGDPLTLYCRPSDDYVPDPQATLVTGITPQDCLKEGLPEAEFIQRINEEFLVPGTCGVGYNSLRFDDEVTRQTLYRNLRDPYAREWKNGNSRWDIIDMVRLAYAVRPEGIEWPRKEDGTPSFRLEDLTAANNIEHGDAHDAMADVRATIALAKLIREKQPRLYEYVLSNRSKDAVFSMLDSATMKPVLHVSAMYPPRLGCCALVAPVAVHPRNRNSVIVFDLRQDPSFLAEASPEQIRDRLFRRGEDMEEGEERPALKEVRANTCPVLAPATMLKSLSEQRLQDFDLDRDRLQKNLRTLREIKGLSARLQSVYEPSDAPQDQDPDESLYTGGFIRPADRELLDQALSTPVELLGELELPFEDPRLPELFFRYRARNYPETLNAEEQEQWVAFRKQRLLEPPKGWQSLPDFFRKLESLFASGELTRKQELLLQDLKFYGESLVPYM
ncbi:exodeoxyribonuclease I subunit C [Halospina denitrificans]|uniref:Exodeoxyribonuclease I n=1 Tax=Halospina denitrificans TaxID=332522 RepID=A0A4R7JMF9_9GAMM|nr:exodeoxyribonuclease I [Halospina denitrificans]TDT39271.1 exodeoxyribonuclease I subunit C [Halospina denitrificans]